MPSWSRCLGGVVLAAALGCTPSIPFELPPDRVVAEYDPAVPRIPLPNDLAIDADTGLVSGPDAADASAAEREFNRYLRTLDGFSPTASATCTFSGSLDPASVTAAAVRVLDVTDPSAVRELAGPAVAYEADRRRVVVRAKLERARVYAVALVGGERGLRGAEGQQVVGAPAFALLRASRPLASCQDLAERDCRATTSLLEAHDPDAERANVVALERARRALQPGLAYLEAQGLPREQLVASWTFRTVRMGLATFDPDPAKPAIPFPNDLLLENGRVRLPSEPGDDLTTQLLKLELNKLDGFSTTASLVTENGATVGAADVRLDPGSLSADQFVLASLEGPEHVVPLAVRCRGCAASSAEPDQLVLTPERPLRSHTRYVALWRRGAKTLEGWPVNAPVSMALFRLSSPLFENGRSTLSTVDDLTAAAAEPYRQRLQPALAWADARGIAREELVLAWSFTTQTTTEPMAALANKPAEWGLPTGLSGGPGNLVAVDLALLQQLSLFMGVDLHSELRWAKEGELTGANALDPDGTELDVLANRMIPTDGPFTPATLGDGRRLEPRRFFLVVPKRPKHADGRIPVVVFQHGLGRARKDAALIANQIAKAGYATLAIDAPFHGLRSYCQDAAACRPGTACVDHRCADALSVPDDGYRIQVVPGPFGPTQDPTETPEISGDQFISGTNLAGNRDHLRQQVIDLAQLLRSLSDTTLGIGAVDVDDPSTSGVRERLDPSSPRYVGISLGGIIGTMALSAIPELSSATLNVPGASLTDVVLQGDEFKGIREPMLQYLARRGMPQGSQAYESFLDVARWVLDPADPQNFGRHLIAEPLTHPGTGAPLPRKRVFVSWVKGDTVVPNVTTALLLRSIEPGTAPDRFSQKLYTSPVACAPDSPQSECGDHAFLLNVMSAARARLAVLAQAEAVQWVDP